MAENQINTKTKQDLASFDDLIKFADTELPSAEKIYRKMNSVWMTLQRFDAYAKPLEGKVSRY